EGVDTLLAGGVEGGDGLLCRTDLAGHELEPLVARDRLRPRHQVAGLGAVEHDADPSDLRPELFEHADCLLDGHVHAGASDVLSSAAYHTGRIEDHGVTDGHGARLLR